MRRAALVLLLAACQGAPVGEDDAGLVGFDGGPGEDAGAARDAGLDAGAVGDAGPADAGPGDAGMARCSGPMKTVTGLAWGAGGVEQTLDLYLPESGEACPLIIWIHGGGWQSGSKELGQGARTRVLRHVERGFAVASINYRLSGTATFPAQIHDVKAALRWLRANAATWRLDGARFIAWGTSAGGHLAALAGTSGAVAELEDLSQGNPTASSRVQGAIDCYGPTFLPAMDAQLRAQGCGASHDDADSAESRLLGCTAGLQAADCVAPARLADPRTWLSADDPPFLIGHGTADCTVPQGQGALLFGALGDAGLAASFHLRDGGAHLIESCPDDEVLDGFLAQWL